MNPLRIATRRSPLALWQAEHVAARLRALHPQQQVELLPMVTTGDVQLEGALSTSGGKGLFVKELELALLEDRADLAVHSMKDVPAQFPEGLGLVATLQREDPRDALVGCASLEDLREGARIGTASQRRELQLRRLRPDLDIGLVRGNVGTRLDKLDRGDFDALVLAAAGLKRLGLHERIGTILATDQSLPAVGQGALGLECRLDDDHTRALLTPLEHDETAACVAAERAFGCRLGGSCQLPLAAHAVIEQGRLELRGLLGLSDGSALVSGRDSGPANEAESIGKRLAETLLASGGDAILERILA